MRGGGAGSRLLLRVEEAAAGRGRSAAFGLWRSEVGFIRDGTFLFCFFVLVFYFF